LTLENRSSKSATRQSNPAAKAVIDWTAGEASHEPNKNIVGASAQKASWLQRFLFHTGLAEVKPHDHGIEVVLPGKKQ
jgi:hypothetical protein